MRALREFGLSLPQKFDDREGVGILAPNPGDFGRQVGWDRRWLWLYSLHEALGESEFGRLDGVIEPFEGPLRFPPVPNEIDPEWTCRSWEEATGVTRRSPFVVRILSDPVISAPSYEAPEGLTRIEGSRRFDLAELPTARGLVRVVREPRRASVLGASRNARAKAGARGQRIWQTPGNAGTAGGILEVQGFGECTTTAGHVAPRLNGRVFAEFDNGASIGKCVGSPDYSLPGLVDETAVVEISGHPWKRSADSMIRLGPEDLGPGRPLTVLGARTSYPNVFPVDYIQYRTLQSGTGAVRIDDGFELRRHSDGFFGAGAGFRRPTLPGDSGAWVVRADKQDLAWAGSVVGGDDVSTVATFSSNTMAELGRKFGSVTLPTK